MSSIGNTLKDARTKQNLTLEEVHAKIKIHPRVLEYLESDDFDKLPSPLFVKSFIKAYAEFLSLDPEGLLRIYDKSDTKKEPEQTIFIRPAEYASERSFFDQKFIVWALTGAVALVVLLGAIWGIRKVVRFAERWAPETQTRSKASAAASKTTKTKAAATGKAAPAKETAAVSSWLRSPEQGNFPVLARGTALELKLKAIDNVWLRVTVDGKVLFQSVLKRAAAEAWSAKESIEIWTGNSSNMVLTLNGFNLGSPGKGVVKKLVINHHGVKIPQ